MKNKEFNEEITNQNNEEIQSESANAEMEETKDELTILKEKNEELNDKYLRLYSDFENFRKRTAKEKMDILLYAEENTIKDILPILDDYERALQVVEKEEDIDDTTKEGLTLIYSKFTNFLNNKNVEPIKTLNMPFDESTMEAITRIPANNNREKGLVKNEVLKGYTLKGKVIRYAKVVVAN